MTPVQWAKVLNAGWMVTEHDSELEKVLRAMAREAERIAKETQ
jgi:hypothetical protein